MRNIDLLAIGLQTPGALPICMIGDPGIGKTQMVGSLMRALDWRLEVLSPGMRGEGAFGVVPVPDMDANVLRYPPCDWVVGFENDPRPGNLFIDEINTAAPALQPPLLGLLAEGRIGDKILPERVRRCAAMNPTELAAGGWDLPPALANRLIYLPWASPTAAQWTEWLTGAVDSTVQNTPTVEPQEFERELNMAKAIAAGFLRHRPALLSEDPDKVKGRFPLAYATPRTWESAVRLIASCRACGYTDAVLPLVTGALGEPVAIELVTWMRENDLPDPERLLANPTSWKIDPSKMDRIFATCLAVAKTALLPGNGKPFTKKEKTERWNQAWHVLSRAIPHGKDLVILPANDLAKADNRPEGGLIQEDVKEIVRQIAPVVFAAGTK